MPWVRFDDGYPEHRKIKSLPDGAYRVHNDAIHWCGRHLTDGYVPESELKDATNARRPHHWINELVRRSLWEIVEGGWQIHDYLDYQPSRAQVLEARRAKAERQARWVAKQAAKKNGRRPRDASQDASRDVTPYPHPNPTVGRGSGEGAHDHPDERANGTCPHGADRPGLCAFCRRGIEEVS